MGTVCAIQLAYFMPSPPFFFECFLLNNLFVDETQPLLLLAVPLATIVPYVKLP